MSAGRLVICPGPRAAAEGGVEGKPPGLQLRLSIDAGGRENVQ